ncbi:hypothetical protein D3C75_438100 [compost metagenome]
MVCLKITTGSFVLSIVELSFVTRYTYHCSVPPLLELNTKLRNLEVMFKLPMTLASDYPHINLSTGFN